MVFRPVANSFFSPIFFNATVGALTSGSSIRGQQRFGFNGYPYSYGNGGGTAGRSPSAGSSGRRGASTPAAGRPPVNKPFRVLAPPASTPPPVEDPTVAPVFTGPEQDPTQLSQLLAYLRRGLGRIFQGSRGTELPLDTGRISGKDPRVTTSATNPENSTPGAPFGSFRDFVAQSPHWEEFYQRWLQ
jgi:hypothetical protein